MLRVEQNNYKPWTAQSLGSDTSPPEGQRARVAKRDHEAEDHRRAGEPAPRELGHAEERRAVLVDDAHGVGLAPRRHFLFSVAKPSARGSRRPKAGRSVSKFRDFLALYVSLTDPISLEAEDRSA